MTEVEFRWSDAWLLLAIGYAAEHADGTLADVIGIADGIQHAIPLREELNGAIGRLSRAGYAAYDGARLGPTEAGRALLARAAAPGRPVLAVQDALARLLDARPWSAETDPSRAGDCETD